MKLKLFFIFLTIVFCLTNSSCNKADYPYNSKIEDNVVRIEENEDSVLSVSFKSENILFKYKANTKENVTISRLDILSNELNNGDVISIGFTVDSQQPSYKLASHEEVILNANDIKDIFNLYEISKVARLYEVFGKEILKINDLDTSNQLVQSLFFHNASLLTIKRSLTENKDCGCTPHPGYFVGKNAFFCQEDYFISPKSFIDYIDKANYKMNSSEKELYKYLQINKSKSIIPINELLNILEPNKVFMQRVSNVYFNATNKDLKITVHSASNGDCFKGSDLGCCGNYSGCCWYSSLMCLYHDVQCIKCSPSWYCLPGCKKEVRK